MERLLPRNRLSMWAVSFALALALAMALSVACSRDDSAAQRADQAAAPPGPQGQARVTISGDDAIAGSLTWRNPAPALSAEAPDALDDARRQAARALQEGRLHADADAAIPLYLAILQQVPDDVAAREGLEQSMAALLAQGDAALAAAGDDPIALREARVIAAVARSVRPGQAAVAAYLSRLDVADRVWELNRRGEQQLREGDLGAEDGGAVALFREALRLQPGQARAAQGLAAAESTLIRRAEQAAGQGDFEAAAGWLDSAAEVRPGHATVADARGRVEQMRAARIGVLRDEGIAALQRSDGLPTARERLAAILVIARPGDTAAAELRERIDLATHYGLFRPGQAFTDAFTGGTRGPRLRVVPHGGFRMGAPAGEPGGQDHERPQHYVRFDRGFAMSIHEVTVGEFRRFIAATDRTTRADRRGYSMVYDERSGNFVRRSGVDWQADFAGRPATDDLPVVHVSAADARAYAEWLSEQSGERYRLPSEAEFEYALRAGGSGRYPWGNGRPTVGAGNLTGSLDQSPGGRQWKNAFAGHDDSYWGPAPVGRFAANAFGLHDLAGNVSEWVADCWHDGYRRAPANGAAWINPGCRTYVVRGGSWASSPEQSRSAWRAPADGDTTNPRIGFRVVREL